jgi:uncharacterized small protein (TIGR04563 family)
VARRPNVQSVYIPDAMLSELREESLRLERNLPWLIKRAWLIARDEIRALPAPPKVKVFGATEGGE